MNYKKPMNLVEAHKKDINQDLSDVNDRIFRGPHRCNLGASDETDLDIRTREQYLIDNEAELNEICKYLFLGNC
jgi:hypothetical protein